MVVYLASYAHSVDFQPESVDRKAASYIFVLYAIYFLLHVFIISYIGLYVKMCCEWTTMAVFKWKQPPVVNMCTNIDEYTPCSKIKYGFAQNYCMNSRTLYITSIKMMMYTRT